ncbi:2-hydroxyacid dehydrogenase [Ruminococcaceae bacterium OttesenSCG-928-L11]|nr:2-hydroxyacid dehydrogenase [Ruminococcaceae bacterium OttesenSCG-928-L11]
MKIAFFDTKPYDRIWFQPLSEEYGFTIKFYEYKLNTETAVFAKGFDVVCVFVNDPATAEVIDLLHQYGVGLLALRCSGYNQVDLKAAQGKIPIVRVPSYSPTAIAEHAIALLLAVNRKIHRAYTRTRDNNFNINGLMGTDLRGKTIGVAGTGRIGQLFAEIAAGFGMRVLAYDPYPNPAVPGEYVGLDTLLSQSDILSLHCPLTRDTHHMIRADSIAKMKDGVLIINTSRGALIDTEALLDGLKSKKIGGAGLDVYEEEEHYFFEDLSDQIIDDDELARLLSFPNVIVTSHQAFFTREAMEAIARVTLDNIREYADGKPLTNEVTLKDK